MISKENTKYIKIDYPPEFMLSVYNPYDGDFLLFPDALDIFLEAVGGYELLYGYLKKKESDSLISVLIYKSYLDKSFIVIDAAISLVQFEKSLYIPIIKILESTLIYEDKRIDISDTMTKLIGYYPKKIDLLSFLFDI
ncbi:MAG: hypothetical protein N3D78_03240 [Candidatus Aenigmarchaeota archaeon]|nr:hypothetical protein [Candidatus Aenigmarchaeota archaeon]